MVGRQAFRISSAADGQPMVCGGLELSKVLSLCGENARGVGQKEEGNELFRCEHFADRFSFAWAEKQLHRDPFGET